MQSVSKNHSGASLITAELWHSLVLNMQILKFHFLRFVVCDRRPAEDNSTYFCCCDSSKGIWQIVFGKLLIECRAELQQWQVSLFSAVKGRASITDRTDPNCQGAQKEPRKYETIHIKTTRTKKIVFLERSCKCGKWRNLATWVFLSFVICAFFFFSFFLYFPKIWHIIVSEWMAP